MKILWFGKRVRERCEYASSEEFANTFERERDGLQRLALLLTTNSEAAKLCLSHAFRECVAGSSVSKEWVLNWARRVVIRNAINFVLGPEGQSLVNTNGDADNGLIAFSPDDSPDAVAESQSILGLPEFERLVFVICVLECYSIHDCALLLGKSPREVNEVLYRVRAEVGQIDELWYSSRHFNIRKLYPSTAEN